ncbi:glycosyl hydrolase, partial [Streptomyces sp. JV178]|uniref:RICIN domain-containing protein n=1 Tax=Streptomyces sp. JV178 TaxID=858632 RepID=UPI000C6AA5BC
GARGVLWSCNGGANQDWPTYPGGSLRNPQSGKCLDVSGGGSADGTLVHLWTCHGGANQKWTLP